MDRWINSPDPRRDFYVRSKEHVVSGDRWGGVRLLSSCKKGERETKGGARGRSFFFKVKGRASFSAEISENLARQLFQRGLQRFGVEAESFQSGSCSLPVENSARNILYIQRFDARIKFLQRNLDN